VHLRHQAKQGDRDVIIYVVVICCLLFLTQSLDMSHVSRPTIISLTSAHGADENLMSGISWRSFPKRGHGSHVDTLLHAMHISACRMSPQTYEQIHFGEPGSFIVSIEASGGRRAPVGVGIIVRTDAASASIALR